MNAKAGGVSVGLDVEGDHLDFGQGGGNFHLVPEGSFRGLVGGGLEGGSVFVEDLCNHEAELAVKKPVHSWEDFVTASSVAGVGADFVARSEDHFTMAYDSVGLVKWLDRFLCAAALLETGFGSLIGSCRGAGLLPLARVVVVPFRGNLVPLVIVVVVVGLVGVVLYCCCC